MRTLTIAVMSLLLAAACTRPSPRPRPAPETPKPSPSPVAEAKPDVCEEVKTVEIRGHRVPAPLAVTQVYCEHHRDSCCILTAALYWQWGCNNARNREWYMETCEASPSR